MLRCNSGGQARTDAGSGNADQKSWGTPATDESGEFPEASEELGKLCERQSVGAVREGGSGIFVGLEEDTIDTRGDTGACERLDEFRLAATGVALSAGKLHGVGDIVYDGIAELGEYREGAHIDDEIVVAEACAAFGENDLGVARGGNLFGDVAHVPGRKK